MSTTNEGTAVDPKPACELIAGCKNYEALQSDNARLRGAIRAALNELGEPSPGIPAPVAEARRGLLYALMNEQCPPCDMGENTECVCPAAALSGTQAVKGEKECN